MMPIIYINTYIHIISVIIIVIIIVFLLLLLCIYIYILVHILSDPSQGSILSFEEVNLIQQEMFVELCLVPDTSCTTGRWALPFLAEMSEK